MKEHIKKNLELTSKKVDEFREKKKPGPGVQKRHKLIVDIINKYWKDKDAYILDVGCREGFLFDMFKRDGYKNFYGIEISSKAVEFLHDRGYGGEVMDCENITLNNTFDIVTASHVLEHTHDAQKTIDGIYNVLNKNGILYIEVPKQPTGEITQWGHFYRFSDSKDIYDLIDFNKWKMLHRDDETLRYVFKK